MTTKFPRPLCPARYLSNESDWRHVTSTLEPYLPPSLRGGDPLLARLANGSSPAVTERFLLHTRLYGVYIGEAGAVMYNHQVRGRSIVGAAEGGGDADDDDWVKSLVVTANDGDTLM
jgi:hypothetical protein